MGIGVGAFSLDLVAVGVIDGVNVGRKVDVLEGIKLSFGKDEAACLPSASIDETEPTLSIGGKK